MTSASKKELSVEHQMVNPVDESIDYDLRMKAAINKIKSQFENTPKQMLFFAVIEKAIRDLKCQELPHRLSARSFLTGEMMPAEVCGVDSGWIRRTIREFKLIDGA